MIKPEQVISGQKSGRRDREDMTNLRNIYKVEWLKENEGELKTKHDSHVYDFRN